MPDYVFLQNINLLMEVRLVLFQKPELKRLKSIKISARFIEII